MMGLFCDWPGCLKYLFTYPNIYIEYMYIVTYIYIIYIYIHTMCIEMYWKQISSTSICKSPTAGKIAPKMPHSHGQKHAAQLIGAWPKVWISLDQWKGHVGMGQNLWNYHMTGGINIRVQGFRAASWLAMSSQDLLPPANLGELHVSCMTRRCLIFFWM